MRCPTESNSLQFTPPMLLRRALEMLDEPGRCYEVKFDGYRMQAALAYLNRYATRYG